MLLPGCFSALVENFKIKNNVWELLVKVNFSAFEKGLTVNIFDRYGQFLKALTYESQGWDGTFKGSELPSNDYWFVVTRQDGREYRGHFALKR